MLKIKTISLILLTTVCLIFSQNYVFANDDEISIDERIASIGIGKLFTADPQKEITNLFKKIDLYNEKSDFKKIKTFYSEDFINNDGFDANTFLKSMKTGFSLYENKKMNTKINSISVNDNYAVVHVSENGEADTIDLSQDIKEKGHVLASADVYYFLQKNNKKWQIVSANVIDENFTVLYGFAKNVYFALNVPRQIKAGAEYTASLSFAPMKDVLVSASIEHKPIIFPVAKTVNSFKTVNSDGVLERIFVANSNNYNEYVIATIGLSRPKMITPENFNIELTGTAFVLRRVNVFKPLPQKQPVEKTKSHYKKSNEKE